MNSKSKKILRAILQDTARSDIKWNEIENLLISLGAEVSEGRGSRVRVALNGVRAVFHRPHPKKVADKGAIKSIKRFLLTAGVKYDL